MPPFAAIVLAGGASRRMAGGNKLMRPVAGRPMLHTALAAVADAAPRIVVGPAALGPDLPPGVLLTLEDPPGGGPVAATGAGLTIVPAEVAFVAVVAADQPFVTGRSIRHLVREVDMGGNAGGDAVGAVFVDSAGRQQRGLTVWRARALRRFLTSIGDLDGVAMSRLTRELGVVEVDTPVGTEPPPWYDCDTEEDLRRAEEWSHADPG
jgi:molybdenum cofactor guanylyltransferase